MIEGQFGLTWERWVHILRLAERLGFASVFRTDHFFVGKQRESLDSFLSFAVAAHETRNIRFGPLCTSFSFQTPANTGRMSAQLDVLSGGRFVLGLGISWYEPEFRAYGIPFPSVDERFNRQHEGIEILHALWSPGSSTYTGKYYNVEEVNCLPKPTKGKVPIIIGGTGEKRTLRLAAQYADEWNCDGYLTPKKYAHKVRVLEKHCQDIGRNPAEIRRSMLVHVLTGPNQKSIDRVAESAMDLLGSSEWSSSREAQQEAEKQGMIVGEANQIAEQLSALATLGVNEVQLEHFDFSSDEVPEYIASEIIPKVVKL